MFIALHGPHANGHDYLDTAVQKGARGLIISDVEALDTVKSSASKPEIFVIQVADTLKALHAIAAACRRKHSIPLTGVTGSNGKTTVKDMSASILSQRYQVLKSYKSFNNHFGLPLTLANMTEEHEVAVLEMGMNGPGEIRRLALLAQPQVGLITNVACAHLGFFASIEEIMTAKLELIEALPDSGIAVLNADDPRFAKMLATVDTLRLRCITFGCDTALRPPTITARDIAIQDQAGYRFTLVTPEVSVDVTLPLPGYHNINNALAAAAVTYALLQFTGALQPGVLPEIIKNGIEHVQPSPMRMQVSEHHGVQIINDAYNANPISMASGLNTLKNFPCQGRRIALLGDMLELGDISQSAHYDVGYQAVQAGVDRVLLLGEYADEIARGARKAGLSAGQIVIGQSHTELAEALRTYVQPGDVVFCKASRGIALENVLTDFINQA